MSRTYDIVIIGSGIAGSISAAILAKHGLKTLILDAGQHPRFSIGEAMPPPESGLLLRLLAQRFGIPELAFIPNPEQIVRHIGSSACGIKLAFSFAWHAAGVDSAAEHVVAPPLDAPGGPPVSPGHRLLRLAARAPARRERPPPHAHRRIRVPSRGCGHPSRRRRKPASSLCHRPGLYVGIQCNCLKFHLSGTPEQEFSGCWIYPSSPSTSQRPLQCRIRHMGYSSTVIAAPLGTRFC